MVLGSNVDPQDELCQLVLDVSVNKCHTVSQLAADVRQKDSRYSFEEVCNAIKILERQGHVVLVRPPYPFARYYFSYHLEPLPLLRLAGVLVATCATLLLPSSPLQVAAVFAFLLFSPGYSVIELLFSGRKLDLLETAALSVGFSIIIIPVVAIIVNFALGSLDTPLVVVILAASSIVISIVAVYRARRRSEVLMSY